MELSFSTTVASIINGQLPAAAGSDNSYSLPWDYRGLPYKAPPFDKIAEGDYKPAILGAIARQKQQIDAIARSPQEPNFENSLAALERATAPLDCLRRVLATLVSTNASETLEAVQTELAPALQASEDSIYLNEKLFHRIRRLYATRERLGLDGAPEFLLARTYEDFVRSGAALSASEKTRLYRLNEQIAVLTTEFEQRLRAGRNASAVTVQERSKLDGLGETEIAAARTAGSRVGSAGYLLELRTRPSSLSSQSCGTGACAGRSCQPRSGVATAMDRSINAA